MGIKHILATERFEDEVRKVKGKEILEKLKKQVKKICKYPDSGKPLRYALKGERSVYVKPYRLIYSFDKGRILLLRFEHRKKVYRKSQ